MFLPVQICVKIAFDSMTAERNFAGVKTACNQCGNAIAIGRPVPKREWRHMINEKGETAYAASPFLNFISQRETARNCRIMSGFFWTREAFIKLIMEIFCSMEVFRLMRMEV